MQPSKVQKPVPADLSRLNVDDALKIRPIPPAKQWEQHPYSAYALLIAAALIIVVGYVMYTKGLDHQVLGPITTQNTTMAPAPATEGNVKPVVPAPMTPGSTVQPTPGTPPSPPATP